MSTGREPSPPAADVWVGTGNGGVTLGAVVVGMAVDGSADPIGMAPGSGGGALGSRVGSVSGLPAGPLPAMFMSA
jgi:hypothetical protein